MYDIITMFDTHDESSKLKIINNDTGNTVYVKIREPYEKMLADFEANSEVSIKLAPVYNKTGNVIELVSLEDNPNAVNLSPYMEREIWYDDNGREILSKSPLREVRTEYDDNGNESKVSFITGIYTLTNRYYYDEKNRPLKSIGSYDNNTSGIYHRSDIIYDDTNNTSTETFYNMNTDNEKSYSAHVRVCTFYDNGLVKSSYLLNEPNSLIEIEYNEKGGVIKETNGDGLVCEYEYDYVNLPKNYERTLKRMYYLSNPDDYCEVVTDVNRSENTLTLHYHANEYGDLAFNNFKEYTWLFDDKNRPIVFTDEDGHSIQILYTTVDDISVLMK